MSSSMTRTEVTKHFEFFREVLSIPSEFVAENNYGMSTKKLLLLEINLSLSTHQRDRRLQKQVNWFRLTIVKHYIRR